MLMMQMKMMETIKIMLTFLCRKDSLEGLMLKLKLQYFGGKN